MAASRSAPAPKAVGAVDLGLTSFCVDTDGNRIPALRALSRRLRQLRRAERAQAPPARLGPLPGPAAAHRPAAREGGRELPAGVSPGGRNQILVTETLNVRGMMRTGAWPGRSQMRRQIAYKAQWAQRTHIEVDRWFPSTRRCSACHAVREGLTLADRHWRCGACGAEHDRDVNAARNLEQEGLRVLTGQRPAGPGRSMRVEGNTPGPPPARSGRGPVPDEARKDSTGLRRCGTAEAA